MSIILDALRKSESARLRDADARHAGLPQARARSGMPWWGWAVVLLLVTNLALLAWLLGGSPTPVGTSATTAPRTPVRDLEAVAAAGKETVGELAARGAPRRQPDLPPAQYPVPAEAVVPALPPADNTTDLAASAARAIEAEGALTAASPAASPAAGPPRAPAATGVETTLPAGLPSLEVSLHYFDSAAGRSFVNINGRTARAGTVLPEGPVVEQITAEGAILNYRGQRFLLPRN